jgi:hypothetical protein
MVEFSDPVAHISPLPESLVQSVAQNIVTEVYRQDALARKGKFGGTHIMPGGTDLQRLAVLSEEFGEVSIEVCKGIEVDEQVRRPNLYTELIQVAAVALAWAIAIEDGRKP